jgi:hypothetical protein
MEDFLNFVLWTAFWWVVIKAFEGFLSIRKMKEESAELREHLENKLEMTLHNVKQEQHNDVHYWFDEDNDQFLAQGKTFEEVKEHLKARFKDHIFIVGEKDVFVGPEYECVTFDNEDDISRYVAKVLLQRAGLQIVD